MITVPDTAAAIARTRADEANLPERERLFEDPYARLFAHGEHADEVLDRLETVPFFREHVRLRTRYFDDCVWAALAAQLPQIVLLGAGFDCRAFRLPGIAACDARVFEVDVPAQLEKKRAILAEAKVEQPPFLSQHGADFTDPSFGPGLAASLEAAGFVQGAGTLMLAEGLVSYLDDAAFERVTRWAIATAGSPMRYLFNFHVGRFDPRSIGSRLHDFGLGDIEIHALDELHGAYLAGDAPSGADLFHVAVAQI